MPRNFCCRVLLLLLTYSVVSGANVKIKDVYTKKLKLNPGPGYYLITSIPKGAIHINVTDLAWTRNFFAVRLDNMTYLFNGNYTLDKSFRYYGAGTYFVYIRHSYYSPEMFYSPGPLDSPIDVMLIYNGYPPHVQYEYEIPVGPKIETSTQSSSAPTRASNLEASPTTHYSSTISPNVMLGDDGRSSTPMPRIKRKRRFAWKAAGFNKCSKTCGGGYRTKRYVCMRHRRGSQERVSERKCINSKNLDKPKNVTIRCNGQPCLPQWVAGEWSECTSTCDNGTRSRELQCVQEMSDELRVNLDGKHCPAERPTTIALKEVCLMPDCQLYATTTTTSTTSTTSKPILTTRQYAHGAASSKWKVEEWSACSVTCGRGRRNRVVVCVTSLGRPCNMAEKPALEEPCDAGSCVSKSQMENEIPEALVDRPWMYSAWPAECSSECGEGTLSRQLYCESFLKNETCSPDNMPSMNRTCLSGQSCGQWFTGPWTKCSSSCDIGIETREVACLYRLLGALKVADPHNCPGDKPEAMRGCMGPPCNATWFMSDWTECSRSCGKGSQKREVKCVGPDGRPINASELECDGEKRPPGERTCNDVACEKPRVGETNAIANVESQRVPQKDCRDTLPDCWKIRQRSKESKQKCQSQYYKIGCCRTCRYNY